MSWNSKVGSNEPGTFAARLDGGIRMIIYGQLTGLFGLVGIVIINDLFKNKIFIDKQENII